MNINDFLNANDPVNIPSSWVTDKRIRSELSLLIVLVFYYECYYECRLSNKDLAKLLKDDVGTICRKLSKLQELGYIEINYKRENKRLIRSILVKNDTYETINS